MNPITNSNFLMTYLSGYIFFFPKYYFNYQQKFHVRKMKRKQGIRPETCTINRQEMETFLFLFGETGSHHATQADLKFMGSSDPSTSAFQSPGITGISHHVQPGTNKTLFLKKFFKYFIIFILHYIQVIKGHSSFQHINQQNFISK